MPLSAGQRAGTSFFHALLYSNLAKKQPGAMKSAGDPAPAL
jgi:hypothetical protein